jgi:hypothetical protein
MPHNHDQMSEEFILREQSIASDPQRMMPVASHVVLRRELSFDDAVATHVRSVIQ